MTARFWTKHRLSGHMLKRLAQLSAGHQANCGTPMTALVFRGMVEECEKEVEARTGGGTWLITEHRITDLGREALAEARAEGW